MQQPRPRAAPTKFPLPLARRAGVEQIPPSLIPTRQMTDVPGKRVWGRWPQRGQGGALVFPVDYINKKGQGVTRSVLRTTPWTRWARHAKRALARRAQTRFTYVSFLTRVGMRRASPVLADCLQNTPTMRQAAWSGSPIDLARGWVTNMLRPARSSGESELRLVDNLRQATRIAHQTASNGFQRSWCAAHLHMTPLGGVKAREGGVGYVALHPRSLQKKFFLNFMLTE